MSFASPALPTACYPLRKKKNCMLSCHINAGCSFGCIGDQVGACSGTPWHIPFQMQCFLRSTNPKADTHLASDEATRLADGIEMLDGAVQRACLQLARSVFLFLAKHYEVRSTTRLSL
jgi:hypothetical protein